MTSQRSIPGTARALLAAALLSLLAAPRPAAAEYTRLGALQSYDRTGAGLTLHCEPGATLAIRFLTPAMFRVTLRRPGQDEPALTHAIARTDWAAPSLKLDEQPDRLVLSSAALQVQVVRADCRLRILDADGRLITQDEPGLGIGWDGLEVRDWRTLTADQQFYGLGEKTRDLNKRGQRWVMWNTDHFAYQPDTDPIYQSIPFLLGVEHGRAWGLFLNNSSRTTFNLGAGTERFYSFAAERGLLDYVFIGGPAIPDVLSRYTELTGRPFMPPAWALGYQQSRWSYYPDAEVLALARTFRRKDIPADVIYLDIGYMNGYRVFTWSPQGFPHPAAMLDTLQDLGFKVVPIIDPGVKVDSSYAVAQQGLAHDYFLHDPDGTVHIASVWPGRSYFPDFGKADVREWWGDHDAAFLRLGIDGFWNDMNEPAAWGGTLPMEVVMHDDGHAYSMRRMHNLYGFLMAQATYEGMRRAQPDRRPFVLTRAGFSGEQRYTAVWTGDNVASWEHLQLAVRMILGMGLSGVPFIGTDVGGFAGTPSPELYARWVELGVFTPLFRTHTTINSPSQDPWSFGEYIEGINRRSIRLRYALLPYLYTLMWQAHETGSPPLRPLFWGHQDDPAAYATAHQEEFLAGDHLLVAPVVQEGQSLKRVYLPAGSRWLDLASDSVYDGGREVVVDAPLDRLPMFLEAGGILPRRPPEQYVGQQPADTLYLDAFPGDSLGSFRLYEDDGESYAFEKGGYRVTRFEVVRTGGGARPGRPEIRLARVVEHDGYRPAERMLVARLHAVPAAPSTVEVHGDGAGRLTETAAGRGWAYDPARHVLTVRFPAAGARQQLVVR